MNDTTNDNSQRPAERWKALTADDLDAPTVQRMMNEAAARLSKGIQNVSEEYKQADRLMRVAFRSDAVEEDIYHALEALRDRLNRRCMGHDLGAVHASGSLGGDWFGEEA